MRFTKALLQTSREAPSEAPDAGHALLLRGGYLQRIGPGLYGLLPLGLRVLRRIEQLAHREMDHLGALEISLPVRPAGRGPRADLPAPPPSFEEHALELARPHLRSYRALPRVLYQIQQRAHEEPNPRGLLRSRDPLVLEACAFDANEESALQSKETMLQAARNLLSRLDLDPREVQAGPGGAGLSFQVLSPEGEDLLAFEEGGSYAARLDAASAQAPRLAPTEEEGSRIEKIHTPNRKSIAEVSSFLGRPPEAFLKTLVVRATEPGAGEPRSYLALAVVRGDHEVNEPKLKEALGASALRMATEEEVREATGAAVGFAGPVGPSSRIEKLVVDRDASAVSDGAVGANETDYHLIGVRFGRDFQGEIADIRSVVEGDWAPGGRGKLRLLRGVEVGSLSSSLLGQREEALYTAEDGSLRPVKQSGARVHLSRLMAVAAERHRDGDGLRWPPAIAPYAVHLVTLGQGEELLAAAATLVAGLEEYGIDVLWDDRDERPGVKFKDADLLGMPLRLTLGEKGLKAGTIELKNRRGEGDRAPETLPLARALEIVVMRLSVELG